jgi:putative RNA 2'-phosphotransferase
MMSYEKQSSNKKSTKSMRHELIKDSKFLSLVLRHDPSVIDIKLDEAGWIEVSSLLSAFEVHRPHITRARLTEIVETNNKKRFAFSKDRERIRASQGHSIGVNLGLPPALPPSLLYHGTAERNMESIRIHGLLRGQRDYVHLSLDEKTANTVGSRHGKPIVIQVEAELMTQAGFTFRISENGVWLTEHVPPSFLKLQDD